MSDVRTWAILVGIDNYRSLAPLRNSVEDVGLVRRLLVQEFGVSPAKIVALSDSAATRTELIDTIVNKIRKWKPSKSDQLLFFFAGHADVAKLKRRRTWFLAPVGARIRKGIPDWDTVVTGTEIRRLEETFGGAHILYAFDACYAGMQVKTDAPKKQRVKSAYAIVAGRGGDPVLDEGGKGHSFFTESLATALQGWAPIDTDERGRFRASDLSAFIKNDVPRRLRKRRLRLVQYPFGVQLKISEQGNEFLFSPSSQRLPAATIQALFNNLVHVRKAGVAGLADLDASYSDLIFTALERLVTDDSAAVRAEVAFRLGEYARKVEIEPLVTLLQDDDDIVAITASHSLARAGSRFRVQAIKALKAARVSSHGRRKRIINFSLAKLGDVQSARAVVRDLPIQEGSIRREIIDVLRHLAGTSISDRELTELLQSSLRSNEWRTRRAAAEATGELGLKSATGTLVRLATDLRQHFMVRYAATEALGHLGTELATDAVQKVLILDPSLFARTAAAEAIGVMGGSDVGPQLRHALERDQEWRVRRAAAESCGFLREFDAVASLLSAADDVHFRVRAAVAWALGEIGGQDVQKVLETLATDRSSLVRRSAERSLSQLS